MTEVDSKEQPGRQVEPALETFSPYHDFDLEFDPANLDSSCRDELGVRIKGSDERSPS
jgi:hypothetical protein